MIIVIDTLPGTTPEDQVALHCRKLGKKGRTVKARRIGKEIQFYFEETFEE